MVFLVSTDVQLKKKSHHKHKDVHLDKTFPKDVKFFYTITGLCNYWVDYECASLKRDSVFVIIRPWHKQPGDWKIRMRLFKSCPMLGLDKLAFQ